MNEIMMTIVEWSGSLIGIAGALLIALKVKHSAYGFVFFLVSSLLIIWFGLSIEAYGLVFMQVAYAIINVLGIYRWFFSKEATSNL